MFHGVERGHVRTAEEQLAVERRSIQRPRAEHFGTPRRNRHVTPARTESARHRAAVRNGGLGDRREPVTAHRTDRQGEMVADCLAPVQALRTRTLILLG